MSNKKKNKITFGLKNVHYAPVTESVEDTGIKVTYGTPVRMPGAAAISLPRNAEKTVIAADDDPEYAVVYDNKGYDGDLELYDVPDSYLTDCLGMKIDGETIVENIEDRPVPHALLFEFNGDAAKKRHVLYRCMGNNPDIVSQTKGDGTTANRVTLKITATAAKDTGNIKRTCMESDSDVYKKWYESVPLSGGTTTSGDATTSGEGTE